MGRMTEVLTPDIYGATLESLKKSIYRYPPFVQADIDV